MSKKLLLFVLLPFALLGCKGNPIVGTWTTSSAMGATSMTFKADNTFEATAGTTPIMSGKYEVKGKEVDVTPSKLMGQDVPANTPPGTGTLSDDGKTLIVEGVSYTKQ